ncbi:MAG: ABC transporter permease subunit [Planctomycetes bacterium]|nr:ABC transporter permease subunit [Planctomycetota bacterium]
MLLGPIFRVELVTLARRRRYFLLRVVYGMLMLLVLWGAYSQTRTFAGNEQEKMSIQTGQKIATALFMSFSWLQIFSILAIGPAMAVGTIASERERRTIEYLFATDLANHEIVLGKIIARLCLLGQFILVGLPVLFIFRMLGGISTELLLGTFLLAGSTAVMLTTISVCVSVWSPRTRDATTRVYTLLAVFLILPGFIQSIGVRWFSGTNVWHSVAMPILDTLHMVNPAYILGTALMRGIDLPLLFEAVALQLLLSFLATLLAIAAVRRVHLREATRGVKKSRPRFRSFELPRWRRPLGNSPMIWKEVFSRSAGAQEGIVGRIAKMLLFGVVFIGIVLPFLYEVFNGNAASSRSDYLASLISMSALLGSGILVLLATKAAGSITSEKESDCWLALLATPMTGKEILWGKACGCLYALRWPLAMLTLAWLLGIFLEPLFVLAALTALMTLLITVWFAVSLGLLYSLRSLTTMRAMGATLATLFFCGGGYLFCCCTVMMNGGGNDGSEALLLAPCLPFLLGFPAYGFSENSLSDFSSQSVPFYVAYVCGTVGYLVAGITIFVVQINNFDKISGRTSTEPDSLEKAM